MKLSARAGEIASALALAAPILAQADPKIRKNVAFSAAHIRAAENAMSFTVNTLDCSMRVKAVVEIVEEPGEAAVPMRTLLALTESFPPDTVITVNTAEKVVTVTAGHGRFRLPMVPLDTMPAMLVLEGGHTITLEVDAVLRLLMVIAAAANETTRFYLNGVFLHSVGGNLVAVGTDGHRFLRVMAPADTLSTDRSCIIPLSATKIIERLIRRTRPDTVTLSRSRALVAVQTPTVTFITKSVAAEFPAYERIIPTSALNTITCEGNDLIAALRRIAAVAPADKIAAVVALRWKNGQDLTVFPARQPDTGSDMVAAEVSGEGTVGLALSAFISLLETVAGSTIRMEIEGNGPVVIHVVGNDSLLALQTQCGVDTNNK